MHHTRIGIHMSSPLYLSSIFFLSSLLHIGFLPSAPSHHHHLLPSSLCRLATGPCCAALPSSLCTREAGHGSGSKARARSSTVFPASALLTHAASDGPGSRASSHIRSADGLHCLPRVAVWACVMSVISGCSPPPSQAGLRRGTAAWESSRSPATQASARGWPTPCPYTHHSLWAGLLRRMNRRRSRKKGLCAAGGARRERWPKSRLLLRWTRWCAVCAWPRRRPRSSDAGDPVSCAHSGRRLSGLLTVDAQHEAARGDGRGV